MTTSSSLACGIQKTEGVPLWATYILTCLSATSSQDLLPVGVLSRYGAFPAARAQFDTIPRDISAPTVPNGTPQPFCSVHLGSPPRRCPPFYRTMMLPSYFMSLTMEFTTLVARTAHARFHGCAGTVVDFGEAGKIRSWGDDIGMAFWRWGGRSTRDRDVARVSKQRIRP